ncbi:MAG: 1-phosphofructokinase family hexose kinase [Butyricicoccaceae bacterium]
MIYTVTLNPCIDYHVRMKPLRVGRVNRVQEESIRVGGNGINVSYVLNTLKMENKALSIVAGFTGEEICRLLVVDGIEHEYIWLDQGSSRINMQIRNGEDTSINGLGPTVTDKDIERIIRLLDQVQDGDTVVLAGAVPAGARDTVYADILSALQDRDLRIVVDAKRSLLLNTLKYRPFLIKPNQQELADIFFLSSDNVDDLVRQAKSLQSMGARNVLISMGANGSLLVTEDGQVLSHSAMDGTVRNTVGCGDSMIAGFLSGCDRSDGNLVDAYRMAIAAGSANAFSEGRGTYEEIMKLHRILNKERNRA